MKNVSASPDVRRRIIETARILIGGKGFSAVGLSEIRQASGVPKEAFYRRVGSREAFGEAALVTTRCLPGLQYCPSR